MRIRIDEDFDRENWVTRMGRCDGIDRFMAGEEAQGTDTRNRLQASLPEAF